RRARRQGERRGSQQRDGGRARAQPHGVDAPHVPAVVVPPSAAGWQSFDWHWLALRQGLPSASSGAQRPVFALAGVAQKDGCPIQAFLWQSESGSAGSLSVAQKSVQYPTPVALSIS